MGQVRVVTHASFPEISGWVGDKSKIKTKNSKLSDANQSPGGATDGTISAGLGRRGTTICMRNGVVPFHRTTSSCSPAGTLRRTRGTGPRASPSRKATPPGGARWGSTVTVRRPISRVSEMVLVVDVISRVRVVVGKSGSDRVNVCVPGVKRMVPPGVRPLPNELPLIVTSAGGSTIRRTLTGAGVGVGLGSGVSVGVGVSVPVGVGVAVGVEVGVGVGIHGAPASPKTNCCASFEKYRIAAVTIRSTDKIAKM